MNDIIKTIDKKLNALSMIRQCPDEHLADLIELIEEDLKKDNTDEA